jgi:hypothetical protein
LLRDLEGVLKEHTATPSCKTDQTSNGSAMTMDVYLEAGDTVSFDWRFDTTDYIPYNDYAFYSFELA